MAQMEWVLNTGLPYWDWSTSPGVPSLWDGMAGPYNNLTVKGGGKCNGDASYTKRYSDIQLDARELTSLVQTALDQVDVMKFTQVTKIGQYMVHL